MSTLPKEHAFLAASMKSGGTHISNCLCSLLGWRGSTLCSGQQTGTAEQDINPYVSGNILPQGAFVFHQHTRAWPSNTDVLKMFGVRPIVLIRNVADVIVSVRDQCLALDRDPKLVPGVYVPASFNALTRDRQEVFLVQNLGPWLLSFYVSWKRQTDVECLWVTYEEHFADQVTSFRRMLDWIGHGKERTDDDLRRMSETKPHNFNVGRSGRGRDLCHAATYRLTELAETWGPEWTPQIKRDLLSWPTSVSEAQQTFYRPSAALRM